MVHYLKRTIETTVKEAAKQFPAVAITGPRQSGKSTLLLHCFKRTHKYITFDDPAQREYALSDPKAFLEQAGDKVIFDEIQYVPELLSYIKILIDKDRGSKGRFLLTGSCQFNLMKGLSETLAGRIALLNLFPFTYGEKCSIPGYTETYKTLQKRFTDIALKGSYPEPATNTEMDTGLWYGSYLSVYIEKDIRSQLGIGLLREFDRFLRLLAGRCAQILNMSSLAADVGVSLNTIKSWVSVLETSQVIYILMPYHRNFGKRITKSPKVYFMDTGLVCHLVGIKETEHILNGPMSGALFENFVIQETLKLYSNAGKKIDAYFINVHKGGEVDLLYEENLKVYPVEIKSMQTVSPSAADQIVKLKKAFPQLDYGESKVVTLADEGMVLKNDIKVMSYEEYFRTLQGSI